MATTSGRGRARHGEGGLLLCRVAGVPVLLSPSWWVGAAVIVLLYTPLVGRLLPGATSLTSGLVAAAFTVLLALSVLLHELGHCLVALRLGLPVRRVRLFLLGGITEISRTPPRPGQEGVVAVAGPAVSIALAGLTGVAWLALPPGGAVWLLVAQTCVANLAVGVFNLLPGLPLDGGRMLRALTWAVTGRRHAGTTAGVVGAGAVAVGLIVWALVGLLGNADDQWLRLGVCVLLAWFVVAGAGAEHNAEQRRHWPDGLRLEDLVRPVLQLPAESPVRDALVAAAGRGVVLVRADGLAVGLLDETAAERLAAHAPLEPAERASEPVGPETILLAGEPPEAVLERVQSVLAWQFLVLDADGRPNGVLRREDLRSALHAHARRG
ncbi:Zn-dependent protease [Saccharopolyspora erythraea NRRL 2338]|uniref:Zinc metalloprotease n=2 Tax=Saccharopolyspora erythraea TaxID=1836 RepID=A4FBX3_SACEN|nr:site-2 protease family protein [Saccharopolyspora erythraea]EQD82675.1 peptidase M50 [Saccharopolyspora erythraea D]PFG95320.1 Zn-dependent protease [Saccharopolyspora erythraea NRRL 2338]QRK91965.1 site-2 protease family protein [Saccharopolyspora erythraea]CAM01548.1 peptidase M50 [Saccharopolyspora erythraea NRRL 2338]